MDKYGYTRKEAEVLLGKEDDGDEPIHNIEFWAFLVTSFSAFLGVISALVKRNKKEDKKREELIV